MDAGVCMNRIAIIGAMEAEVTTLKSALHNVQTHSFGKAATVYTGELFGKNIVLCQSGIGKVNAAIATTLVIDHFSPDCVINTGSAGGIGKGLRVGDVVIGTEIAHHDVDVTAFGYAFGQVPQHPTHYTSSLHLIELAQTAACAFDAANVQHGMIISGDQFVNDQTQIDLMLHRFPQALAVEMEAAAIAQTCYQMNKPFVIIRAISDSAEENAKVSFETFLITAAEHSAKMVQNIIQAA